MGTTNLMVIFIVPFFLYVGVEGGDGGGIVKGHLENGKDWSEWLQDSNKYIIGCEYKHKLSLWTYSYNIQCVEMESRKVLHVRYDTHDLDLFDVTSCSVDTVVKSIFPPRRKHRYDVDDQADDKGRPTVSYIKYKTEEGMCFARKYKYDNGNPSVAERFEPVEIQCPGYPEFLKYGGADKFTDCRIQKKSLSGAVKEAQEWKDWVNAAPETGAHVPGHPSVDLECIYHQPSKGYQLVLTCSQGSDDIDAEKGDYSAYVSYMNGEVFEKIKVNSCGEDDIVNGIFPEKVPEDTTPEIHRHKLWFSTESGNCYSRSYPSKGEAVLAPTKEGCPVHPEKWTNPYKGKLGQWRDCRGPRAGPGTVVSTRFYHESNGRTDEWEEGKGIVKSVGASRKNIRYNIQHLQCNYRQQDQELSHMYRLYCLEEPRRSKENLKLLVNYNGDELDTFVVTSCVPDDVIKSVFPVKRIENNGDGTAHYLYYKTTEGKCYSSKHKSDGTFKERFEPDVVECEGQPGSADSKVAEFANCRISTLPLSEAVTNFKYGRHGDSPANSIQDVFDNEKLLECKITEKLRYHNGVKNVQLSCVKDSKGVYLSFIHEDNVLLERIGVKSCDEEDIVNGIYLNKRLNNEFKYSYINKKCSKKSYMINSGAEVTVGIHPEKLDFEACESSSGELTNVVTGEYLQWDECTGPRSIKQRQLNGDTQATPGTGDSTNIVSTADGIVKEVFEKGNSWTEQTLNVYTAHLQCKYHPEDETTPEQTYTIQCNEYQMMPTEEFKKELGTKYRASPTPLMTLSVTYGDHKLDTFTVTSCELSDVVASVLPSKHKPAGEGSPTAHIKYVTDKGECFSRQYQLDHGGSPATRADPQKIECDGSQGLCNDKEVAAFTDCRAAELAVSGLVTSWHPGPLFPKMTQTDTAREELLQCTYNSGKYIYSLKCNKGDSADEFLAFVYVGSDLMERFIVTSCEQEKVLNGIFLRNPQRMKWIDRKGDSYYHEIWFSVRYEKCFLRYYDHDVKKSRTPIGTDCPKNIDEWANPKFSWSVKWDSCHKPSGNGTK